MQLCSVVHAQQPQTSQLDKRILIVAGPSTHPPGTHEVAAGGRLIKHCLENATNISGVRVEVVDQWPRDGGVLSRVSTVVFLGDQFPPERFDRSDEIMDRLATMMQRGCGIVCIHYATGLGASHVAADGDHPLLRWIGGYFAAGCRHHQSVARVVTTTIRPAEAPHPVLRGWRAFTLTDEPYWNNYFGKDGPIKNVTPLAVAMLPPDAPREQVVAWGIERQDGGRGMGIVMPHFFRSWQVEDLRKFILNGIVWTAKVEVPPAGVQTQLSDLGAFKTSSAQPQ